MACIASDQVPNQRSKTKKMISASFNKGLLMMFDAHCKAVGRNRTEELERLMRTAIYGRATPKGWDPISGDEIWE